MMGVPDRRLIGPERIDHLTAFKPRDLRNSLNILGFGCCFAYYLESS